MLNFPFSAALMAGGQSRRMGYDKAGAKIAGETLWRRQLALLRDLNPTQLMISGKAGAVYPEAGCDVITDLIPDAGPLGGLITALRSSSTEFLLVLAVDMPAMQRHFLEGLLLQAHAAKRSMIPQGPAGLEPLAAVYHMTSLPIAEECLKAGKRSMRALIIQLQRQNLADLLPIPETDIPFFRNVNTPEELAATEAILRGLSQY